MALRDDLLNLRVGKSKRSHNQLVVRTEDGYRIDGQILDLDSALALLVQPRNAGLDYEKLGFALMRDGRVLEAYKLADRNQHLQLLKRAATLHSHVYYATIIDGAIGPPFIIDWDSVPDATSTSVKPSPRSASSVELTCQHCGAILKSTSGRTNHMKSCRKGQ